MSRALSDELERAKLALHDDPADEFARGYARAMQRAVDIAEARTSAATLYTACPQCGVCGIHADDCTMKHLPLPAKARTSAATEMRDFTEEERDAYRAMRQRLSTPRPSAATVPDAEPGAWLVEVLMGGEWWAYSRPYLTERDADDVAVRERDNHAGARIVKLYRATPTRAEVDAKIEAAWRECHDLRLVIGSHHGRKLRDILRSHFGATVEKSDG